MDGDRPKCMVCGAESPPTNTAYTLIGTQHGWRVLMKKDAAGRRIPEWCCARCWTAHKSEKRVAH